MQQVWKDVGFLTMVVTLKVMKSSGKSRYKGIKYQETTEL